MSRNTDLDVARRYHERTVHTHFSVHTSGHFLDFDIQPLPFKIYEDLAPIPLTPHLVPLQAAVFSRGEPRAEPTLADVARLLFLAAGVTRTRVFPSGDTLHFRAAACTGALYEIDLYVACGDLHPEVPAGLYHFSPHDFSLRRLRAGDVRGNLAAACDATAPLYITSGATFWRNAWKYQARTWRHFGWDDGTILANLHATAAALGLEHRTLCAFVDDDVNALLGLDPMKEVAFSITTVGPPLSLPAAAEVPRLELRTRPLSSEQVDYPLMREVHTASGLASVDEVRRWRAAEADRTAPVEGPPLPAAPTPERSLDETVRKRGSTRHFARDAVSAAAFTSMVRAASVAPALDAEPLCELYVIVSAVEGIDAGTYRVDGERLQALKHGSFRAEAEYLDLEQPLAGDASLNVYFMFDLERTLASYGNRGYRMAQLEAGMRGGAMYLAAYALGLGATGLTFFDDEVTRFFSPHAAALTPAFLVAAGVPVKRTGARR